MGATEERRQQIHLDAWQAVAPQIAIEEVHARPGLHRPAHHPEQQRIDGDCRIGNSVFAEARTPGDRVAMHGESLGNGQPHLVDPCEQDAEPGLCPGALHPLDAERSPDAGFENSLLRPGQAFRRQGPALRRAFLKKR
ncbi:hypothetical protein Tbd_0193 [Thiobacillus denitrificans ATCC 25259]|uniref:Uncharacterized protein n=1 Tax=Thiobacillus denitrificans (strain ATCC 25259 / T1) TaxID=292415 RepID=Q3SF30_THIDA|nr:hypothetical protein Tbd_0193 [Thiobacillus denitrificans ATCC 25259]